MAKQYKDDDYRIITNDLERVRTRPSMYIGFVGTEGILHLIKEIIDNNRDECFKKESPGNKIDVVIDDKFIMSSDNGRGIPIDKLRKIHETIQAGSNMTRDHGDTAGENGTGTSTYTALASDITITTFRPTEKKKLTIRYKEGKLVSEELEDYDGRESGLMTKFYPSKKVLGEDKIPVDKVIEWLEDFRYTLSPNITMTYTAKKKSVTVQHRPIQFYYDNIIDTEQRLCPPLTLNFEGNVYENIMGSQRERSFTCTVSFLYSSDAYKGDDVRKSWMNMIWTMNNGQHVNGCINGLSKFLIERIKSKNKRLADEDLRKDVLSHLNVVVNAFCNVSVNLFESQRKAQVVAKELGAAIEAAIIEQLQNSPQKAIIDQMCEVVIGNNRARKEGEKVRNLKSATKTVRGWSRPDSFIPCSSAKSNFKKEIFLVEGDSAGGGLRSARNPLFQAIIMFRGKSLNVYDQPLDRVLASDPWLRLVKALECGIGETFDINKLAYDKIIIATDADIDGFHIRVEFMTFFVKFMPDIIRAGKLYIAEPPLYKLVNGKRSIYVANQAERIEECIKSIEHIKISFPEMK
jgi:DNA gyrase subunit B